jgi:hypothetical protein
MGLDKLLSIDRQSGKIILKLKGKSMATLYRATERLSRDFRKIFDALSVGIYLPFRLD